eukprot:scaffold747_cov120-Cylindrotheca_fusiformis.AAC.4
MDCGRELDIFLLTPVGVSVDLGVAVNRTYGRKSARRLWTRGYLFLLPNFVSFVFCLLFFARGENMQ